MRKKLMKKHIIMITVTVMLVCVAFILLLCFFRRRTNGIIPDGITEIKISGYNISLFSYTDEKKIAEIVDYLNSLRLSEDVLREDNYYHPVLPTELEGSTAPIGLWRIQLNSESGLSVAFLSDEPAFGYVTVEPYPDNSDNPGNPVVTWWEIPQSQFDKFVPLLKSMIPDKLPRYGGAYDEWLADLNSPETLGLKLEVYGATATGCSLYFEVSPIRTAYPKGRLQTGEEFELDVIDENGNWTTVERIDGSEWGDNILVLKASSTRMDVEWADVYGELPEGHYRIRKTVTDYVDDDDQIDYELYAEFTVTCKNV